MKRLISIAINAFRGSGKDRAAIVVLFAFSAVLIVPAAYIGIPENYDLGQHLRFARTWNNTLAEGGLVPSWGSADNDGLGSAGVRFYPPATHFVMGLTQFATGGWYDTLWVTMLGWMFVGSVGVFKLAREWCSSSVALYSALLYAIVPYHLLQVFQAFLLAEFAAAAFLPFCFLYTHRLVVKGGLINILLFAVAYSALILTHLPTTIMGTLSLAVFALAFMSAGNFERSVGRFALAFAIAATATAFYWVRMVSELSWIKHNTPEYYASGLYNYSTYFFPMLYSSGEAYVARFLWLIDIVIVVTFALLIPALIVVVKKKSEVPRHLIALLSVAGLALFMMSILSEPLWDSIDLLQKLQFPYRWLSPGSLVAALLFPIGIAALAEERSMITRPFAYSLASIFMLLVVLDVSQIIVPSAPVPRKEFVQAIERLDEEPACDCWWPVWASRDVMKNSRRVFSQDRQYSISKWEPTDRRITVEAGYAKTLKLRTFFYPHWKATVNGSPLEVRADPDGLIEIPLPAGTAEVTLEFIEPPVVTGTRYISVIAIAGIFMLLLVNWLRSRQSEIP